MSSTSDLDMACRGMGTSDSDIACRGTGNLSQIFLLRSLGVRFRTVWLGRCPGVGIMPSSHYSYLIAELFIGGGCVEMCLRQVFWD